MGLAVLRTGSRVLGRGRGHYSETARRMERGRSREIRAETEARRRPERKDGAHGPGRSSNPCLDEVREQAERTSRWPAVWGQLL